MALHKKEDKSKAENTSEAMSEENILAAQEMLAKIARNGVRGYFAVIQFEELDDETTQATGHAKVTRCNKAMIIETSLTAVGIEPTDVFGYYLQKNMEEMSGDYD